MLDYIVAILLIICSILGTIGLVTLGILISYVGG